MFEIAHLIIPKGEIEDVEIFCGVLDAHPPAERYVYDMNHVDFIRPYGVVALMIDVRCPRSFYVVWVRGLAERIFARWLLVANNYQQSTDPAGSGADCTEK